MGLVKPARGWRVTDDAWDDIYRGLQGLWLFNDGTGTIVADASGHGRRGTATGATPAAGPAGWCLAYDGNDYVTGAYPAGMWAGDFTTAVRSCRANNAGTHTHCSVQTSAAAMLPTFSLHSGTTNDTVWLYNALWGLTQISVAHGGSLAWRSLAATVRGVVVSLYRDGAVVGTANFSGTRQNSTGQLRVGVGPISGALTAYMVGQTDHAAIWSRALSAQEVRRLHEQPPWAQ